MVEEVEVEAVKAARNSRIEQLINEAEDAIRATLITDRNAK